MNEHSENPNILIVDDHEETRVALKAALAHLDPTFVECGSAEEALRELLKRPFAVILLDIRLPRMDGFELAEAIRARPSSRETPIIFLTGLTRDEPDAARGYALGAVDYLLKPVDVHSLRAKVGVFVSLDRQRRLLERQSKLIASANQRLQDRVEERTAELAHANEELQRSEARYRRLAENAPDVVFRFDGGAPGRFDFVSDAVERTLGYSPEEHYADPGLWSRIAHPDDRPLVQGMLSLHDADKEENSPMQVLRLTHRSGRTIWVEPRATRVRGEGGRVVAIEGIMRDVTRRRELQEQLLQAQRMESIARLAGGIAHDFNNMLTIIQSYGALLLEDLAPDDPAREFAERIEDAAERSARLTGQLLTFSRRQRMELASVDLNALICGIEEILTRTIGEDIDFALRLDEELGPVQADGAQVEQVLMNLVVNARDAMPQGGTLIVETRNVEVEGEDAERLPDTEPGSYARISVTDTGFGMDIDTQSKLFEPFFTTKASGRGTGLGLATVYGIVKQMKGSIVVDSEPGEGTTFEIMLPVDREVSTNRPRADGDARTDAAGSEASVLPAEGASDSPCEPQPQQGTGRATAPPGEPTPQSSATPAARSNAAPPEAPAATPAGSRDDRPRSRKSQARQSVGLRGLGGRETILLVEDEVVVRGAARHALKGAGYTVIEAGDGVEALEVAAAYNKPLDLLVTDVVMPRLGGPALAGKLRRTRSGLRVLFMSGYTDDRLQPDSELEPGMSFLPKPWVPAQLLARVREVLNTRIPEQRVYP